MTDIKYLLEKTADPTDWDTIMIIKEDQGDGIICFSVCKVLVRWMETPPNGGPL